MIRSVNLISVGSNLFFFFLDAWQCGLVGEGCSLKQRWHVDLMLTHAVVLLSNLNPIVIGCLRLGLYCTEDEEHSSWFLNPLQCDVAHLKQAQNVLCSSPLSHTWDLMTVPNLSAFVGVWWVRAAAAVCTALVAFASVATGREKALYSPEH